MMAIVAGQCESVTRRPMVQSGEGMGSRLCLFGMLG